MLSGSFIEVIGLYCAFKSVLMLVDVAHVAGLVHEYQLVVGTDRPLMEMEFIVTALLPVFWTANATTEEVLFCELTHACTFDTLMDSDCVLVWNILPPKKITPAPRTTEAIRIIRVVMTLPIPLRLRLERTSSILLLPQLPNLLI